MAKAKEASGTEALSRAWGEMGKPVGRRVLKGAEELWEPP